MAKVYQKKNPDHNISWEEVEIVIETMHIVYCNDVIRISFDYMGRTRGMVADTDNFKRKVRWDYQYPYGAKAERIGFVLHRIILSEPMKYLRRDYVLRVLLGE